MERSPYKNLLVTGGCGFIGSSFIAYILRKYPDCKVINMDALTYAAHPETVERLQALSPDRYRFVRMDINSNELAPFLANAPGINAVINFAAETHVDRSILDPKAFVTANILGVQNLLTATRQSEVRFIHVSTDEVYGTLEPGDLPFTESTPLSPNSPYAASKASADLLALASYRTYGQEICITRCSNNYGPFQFPEKLIPLVIANALEDKSIPVYGDGKQVRDWIYVEDHCSAIDRVLQQGLSGEVYNISAFGEMDNLSVVKTILNILEKPESLIQFVGDRPAHDRRYALDSSKIKRELGWEPKSLFEDGLRSTVAWYATHEDWWKMIRDKDYFKYYQANYDNKFQKDLSGEGISS
jgi:dTDP-glucose 4,6-dehydratase